MSANWIYHKLKYPQQKFQHVFLSQRGESFTRLRKISGTFSKELVMDKSGWFIAGLVTGVAGLVATALWSNENDKENERRALDDPEDDGCLETADNTSDIEDVTEVRPVA